MDGLVPIYFSHSYRNEDCQLNEFFFSLLWEKGLACTVDPKSDTLSVPHLEVMMRRSAGFSAVVTARPEQKYYRCSPFILFEYALAVQARKPRLVFIEEGVPGTYFPKDDEEVIEFGRKRLQRDREDFEKKIDELAIRTRGYRRVGKTRIEAVGIMMPEEEPFRSVVPEIREIVAESGLNLQPASLEFRDTLELSLRFDRFDVVIVELGPAGVEQWVYALLHGRFVPAIKLFHIPDDGPGSLHPLVRSQVFRGVALKDEPIIFWKTPEDLLPALREQIGKLSDNREEFKNREEGLIYFRMQGRRQASVFISNAEDGNNVAEVVAEELRLHGIARFQYKYANRIELGVEWGPRLKSEIDESELFVAIITEQYPISNWCKLEYDYAEQQNKTIIPYFVQSVEWEKLKTQGRDLTGESAEAVARTIRTDVDARLREPIRTAARMPASVDVAIVTILKEEYEAVLGSLDRHAPATATEGFRNLYGWETGDVVSPTYQRPYRVVVAFAGRAGNIASANAVRDTVQQWKPAYLLIVGIGGGFHKQGLRKGDVVVSSALWGYEYGKIDRGFEPRPDLTFLPDSPILRAAEILDLREPDWDARIDVAAPEKGSRPRVKIGPVASGDKVVDDINDPFFRPVLDHWPKLLAVEMEGAGAAFAVQAAREAGHDVRFAMVRGISDMPAAQAGNTISPGKADSAQTQQRDLWKRFAAKAAACFATQLIRLGWPDPPRET